YALDAASFEEARDDYCRCILRDLEHWREAPYYVSCDQPWHSTIDRRLPATWRQIFSETAHLRRQASAPASRYHFLRKPIEIPRHHKTARRRAALRGRNQRSCSPGQACRFVRPTAAS